MTAETIKGTKAVGERIGRAHIAFVDQLVERGISRDDAIKVKDFYLKNKIAKVDVGIGRISVKHGAFFDIEIINRAISAS